MNLKDKIKAAKDKALNKERVVMRASTMDGGEIKSVERKSGKRVETFKKKDTGYKSRQVTAKDGGIKSTVTKTPQPKGESKYIVRKSGKTVDAYKGDDGVKTRVVTDVDGSQKGKTKYPGGKQKWTVKDGATEWAPVKGKIARDANDKKKYTDLVNKQIGIFLKEKINRNK